MKIFGIFLLKTGSGKEKYPAGRSPAHLKRMGDDYLYPALLASGVWMIKREGVRG